MGLLRRLSGRLFGRRRPEVVPDLDPDDPGLVLLVSAHDPAEADSTVLARAGGAGVDLQRPVLVRHLVVGVVDREGFAAQLDAGYAVAWDGADAHVTRTEVPSAMSLARERSRMAGLAQRCGGDVGGYELLALAPPSVGSGA